MGCSEIAAAIKSWTIAWLTAWGLSLLMFLPKCEMNPVWCCGMMGAIFVVSTVIAISVLN